eukprot:gene7542-9825_t
MATPALVIALTHWMLRPCSAPLDSAKPVVVPSTVFGSLFSDEIFVSDRLNKINTSIYDETWCYRLNQHVNLSGYLHQPKPLAALDLHGINYKADIIVNGRMVRTMEEIVGTFRRFIVDISEALFISSNTEFDVEIRIRRPNDRSLPPSNHDTDLAISFVDWAPRPPDRGMGIFQEVFLRVLPWNILIEAFSASVTNISSCYSHQNSSCSCFSLSLSVTIHNLANEEQNVILSFSVGNIIDVTLSATLKSNSSRTYSISELERQELSCVQEIELWWPWRYGRQSFTPISVVLQDPNTLQVIANETRNIGLRLVTSKLNQHGHRLFYVNNVPFMVYGAGYTPHLFLRYDIIKQRKTLEAVRDMGLNTLRLEGKLMTDDFFKLTDQLGIMVLPGWCCCDAWQHWQFWTQSQVIIAEHSTRTQLRRLRQFPSVLGFLYGSDEAPPKKIEQLYINISHEEAWTQPFIAAASNVTTPAGGPTGMKMNGPYAWVPPIYWTEGLRKKNVFTGRVMAHKPCLGLPLWITTGGLFSNLRFYLSPFNARMGPAHGIQGFLFKSQLMAYEAQRAMFDAYAMYKYTNSTGVVQWMLNNPFPSLIWHLIGGYYGTKSVFGNNFHAALNPHTKDIVVISNLMHEASPPFHLIVQLWSIGSIDKDSVRVVANINDQLFELCHIKSMNQSVVLVRLVLKDSAGNITPDVLDWKNSTFFTTYCSSFANLTGLCTFPKVELEIEVINSTLVQLTNQRNTIAFFVELEADGNNGNQDIWFSDNFLVLYPFETTTVTLSQPISDRIKITYKSLATFCQNGESDEK